MSANTTRDPNAPAPSVAMLPPAREVVDSPARAAARERFLSRVPAGYAIEENPNAPAVAQPDGRGGLPEGTTGVSYGIDAYLRKRGINPEDDADQVGPAGGRIKREAVHYAKPLVRDIQDETDIDLDEQEKTFRVKLRGGRVLNVPLSEPELRNVGMVLYTERKIDRLNAQIAGLVPQKDDEGYDDTTDETEAERDRQAQRLNAKLYDTNRALLFLMVPSFEGNELDEQTKKLLQENVSRMGLDTFRKIIETAQTYTAIRLGRVEVGTEDEVRAYDAEMLEQRREAAIREARIRRSEADQSPNAQTPAAD